MTKARPAGRFGKGLAALVAWTLGTTLACAAVAPATPAEQHLVKSGSTIVSRFASTSGLTALVADNGKEQRLFYEPADGRSLIMGIVFDAQGHNVTQADMAKAQASSPAPASVGGEAAAPAPATAADAHAILARASKSAWIQDGTKGKVLYAIFDPNCPYCHRLHDALRPYVAAGKVQVRWIPVSILTDSGSGTIAATFEAKDPSSALTLAFNHALAPAPMTPRIKLAIAKNVLLLRDTGYNGVPILMYESDGRPAMHWGLPTSQQIAAAVTH